MALPFLTTCTNISSENVVDGVGSEKVKHKGRAYEKNFCTCVGGSLCLAVGRAVSAMPSSKDGHPVAEIILVKCDEFKTVSEKLD